MPSTCHFFLGLRPGGNWGVPKLPKGAGGRGIPPPIIFNNGGGGGGPNPGIGGGGGGLPKPVIGGGGGGILPPNIGGGVGGGGSGDPVSCCFFDPIFPF